MLLELLHESNCLPMDWEARMNEVKVIHFDEENHTFVHSYHKEGVKWAIFYLFIGPDKLIVGIHRFFILVNVCYSEAVEHWRLRVARW